MYFSISERSKFTLTSAEKNENEIFFSSPKKKSEAGYTARCVFDSGATRLTGITENSEFQMGEREFVEIYSGCTDPYRHKSAF